MNQQEWLNWRRGGVGSSDAPVILGVSPWRTPFQLWEEKVFGKDQEESFSMARGKDLEEAARLEFESLMNVSVFPRNVSCAETPWLRASLDGIDLHDKVLVELKCPNKDDHFVAVNKKVPEKYWPQVQHQLAVTGLSGMYYFSFDGSKGVVVEVARDQAYIDSMLLMERAFWEDVLNQNPPALTDRDKVDMESHKEWRTVSEKWKEAKSSLQTAEERENSLRVQLIALSKDRSACGNGVSLNKSICKGNIDYKAAIQEYLDNMRFHYPEVHFPPMALERYRKSSFVKWTSKCID